MRALRPIRPPVAIERAYHKKLKALLKEMDNSLYYWLRAEYRKAEPEIVGDSAMSDLRTKMKYLDKYWNKKYDKKAAELANWFATEVQKQTTRNLQNQMKQAKLAELGFDLKFTYHSRKERAIFSSIVEQNVNLIKSIASEHLTKVQGVVLRGIETGHDLSRMTQDLEEGFGVTERRAAMIARDQTAKASNNLSRQRLMDYGVTKGKWMHTASGKTYRDSHVEMDGEIYDIEEGCYDPDYGDYVQPGELVNCHCVCIPVIDMSNSEESTQEEEPLEEPSKELREESTQEEEPQEETLSVIGEEIVNTLTVDKVRYSSVDMLQEKLSMTKIISRVGGGDLTGGSCSSCALAYAGNRAGIDVLDFRGGASKKYFANPDNILKIAKLPDVKSKLTKFTNDFQAAEDMLKYTKVGKEYYMGVGRHASIIRRTKDGYEYLELQSPNNNGWKKLDYKVLEQRFGCRNSHSRRGRVIELENCIIDIETLGKNKDFKRILGYINTAKDKQKKGERGRVR